MYYGLQGKKKSILNRHATALTPLLLASRPPNAIADGLG
jgi:hypothetical protein